MDKVYLAELDVHTAKLVSKIDQATKLTLDASNKMTMAFNKVNTSMEKDLNRSSIAMNNFSKRDLGMLANQMLYSAGSTGKLTGQLSNLATGLATGGVIGAAFAGFAALINVLTEEFKDQQVEVSGLRKEYDEFLKKNEEKQQYDMKGYDALVAQSKQLKENIKLYESQKNLSEADKFTIMGEKSKLADVNKEIRFYVWAMEKAGFFEKEITNEKGKQLDNQKELSAALKFEYDIWKSMMRPKSPGLVDLGKEQATQSQLEYDIWKSMTRPKGSSIFEPSEKLKEAENPMSALVSLSSQMASNFSFAGHTFVGQLNNAFSMVNSISNMILTVASIFGGGGGFGIGGLLSLIGLEKGGRVSNRFGSLSHTKIPSFAMGGSYSTPSYAGPMAGGYPVMVHKNETLDVYNAGQTSRMEKTLNRMANLLYTNGLHTSAIRSNTRGLADGPIVINLDGKKLFEVVQRRTNRADRAGVNLSQF